MLAHSFQLLLFSSAQEATSESLLFDKNITPGISSRLPLNTASVFYLGVIGKGKKSDKEEISQVCLSC
jgi:hypothetical protein